MADKPSSTKPTPMAEIEDLRTQLATVTGERDAARQSLADGTAKFQKSEADLTARTDELLAERRQHSETKLKLQTAESDLAAEKKAHEALKTAGEEKVQTEAAKIAAANGHPAPVAAAPAAKPGETEQAPDKSKMSANELIAGDIAAATKR